MAAALATALALSAVGAVGDAPPAALTLTLAERTPVFSPYIGWLNTSSWGGQQPPQTKASGYSVRIPAVISSGPLVVAFAQGLIQGCGFAARPSMYCAKDIISRRSLRGGVAGSWEPVRVAVSAASVVDPRDSLDNPSPVFERHSGALFLLFTRQPYALNTIAAMELNPYARETWVARSDDGGRTFSPARNITHVQPRTWTWYSTSPGRAAIQLSGGRLVVPGYHIHDSHPNRTRNPDWGMRPMFGHTIISDDFGKTWRAGAREGPLNVDENQAVALPSPEGGPCVGELCPNSTRLMINARNDGPCTKPGSGPDSGLGCRARAVSDDGGDSFEELLPIPTLPEKQPTCGGLTRWGPYIFFSGVESTDLMRRNITLRYSRDDGASFEPERLLLRLGSGEYSALAVVPTKDGELTHDRFDIACLEYSPWQSGRHTHSSDISLIRVNVRSGLPKSDDDAVPASSSSAHLRWSSFYDTDYPAMRGTINMGLNADQFQFPAGHCAPNTPGPTGCGLRAKLAAWEQFGKSPRHCCHLGCILQRVPAISLRTGMTSFYDLCDHPSATSPRPPNISNASTPWSEDGACPIFNRGDGLVDGWEAALERQVATQIMPHFGPGKALRGVFLGDELCCWVVDCWNTQLVSTAACKRLLLWAAFAH